jgi:hypothetical protein
MELTLSESKKVVENMVAQDGARRQTILIGKLKMDASVDDYMNMIHMPQATSQEVFSSKWKSSCDGSRKLA